MEWVLIVVMFYGGQEKEVSGVVISHASTEAKCWESYDDWKPRAELWYAREVKRGQHPLWLSTCRLGLPDEMADLALNHYRPHH